VNKISYNDDSSLKSNGVSSAVSRFLPLVKKRTKMNQNKVNGVFTLEMVNHGSESWVILLHISHCSYFT